MAIWAALIMVPVSGIIQEGQHGPLMAHLISDAFGKGLSVSHAGVIRAGTRVGGVP